MWENLKQIGDALPHDFRMFSCFEGHSFACRELYNVHLLKSCSLLLPLMTDHSGSVGQIDNADHVLNTCVL